MLGKKDFKLITIVLGISLVIWIVFSVIRPKGPSIEVIYQDKVIKKLDLNVDTKYTVKGTYGNLIVEVKDGKYRITEEECPNHVCSAMGWADADSYLPILCLPNEVMVTMEGSLDE